MRVRESSPAEVDRTPGHRLERGPVEGAIELVIDPMARKDQLSDTMFTPPTGQRAARLKGPLIANVRPSPCMFTNMT
jgi:hypothetical protein